MAFQPNMAMRTCGYCGLRRAQMHVISKDLHGERSTGTSVFHSLLRCPDCANITIIEHNARQTEPKYNAVLRVIPEDPDSAAAVQHLPNDVAKYFSDARRVLDAGVPDAAAVQLRRTLEAAAAHFGITSGTLVKRIEKLIENGNVTKSFGAVLHHIRAVGNQGAHASDERVDEASAEQAVRFTTQLLRNLFEVPEELRLLSADEQPEDHTFIPAPRSGSPL